MKRIAILGSTGSIGVNALSVARHLGLSVKGLAARGQWERLRDQVREFRPARAALLDGESCRALQETLRGSATTVLEGMDGIRAVASADDVDVVLSAITGAAGLAPGLDALEHGKTLALANKESLVAAGPLMMAAGKRGGGRIVPVDSEHSAVFQALQAGKREEVRRVILTASGGPFRETPAAELTRVTVEQALRHPTWRMGDKITIDSATMMNKALEIVEARWLFELDAAQIEVLVHPQSIVHSLVEFRDGSMIAQLGSADMRIPIQYALTYPDRLEGNARRLDLAEIGRLTFEPPDLEKFPAIRLGYRAAREGGTMGCVLNAANEVVVHAFLEGRISFPSIAGIVENVMDAHSCERRPSLDDIMRADAWARAQAEARVNG
ncbi:MAG: 1-deoxy-D-xylulose-5-phosphate reductoisomerase [Planctomycetes bacterium]|nr:1-deoxy-D-xylulose-5-phosphate reductoisomerase [Planctomycetota bacterium]